MPQDFLDIQYTKKLMKKWEGKRRKLYQKRGLTPLNHIRTNSKLVIPGNGHNTQYEPLTINVTFNSRQRRLHS